MTPRIAELVKTQTEIESFFRKAKGGNAVLGVELRAWIVKSVAHFSKIHMSQNLIDLFVSTFPYSDKDGGFGNHGIFRFKLLDSGYMLRTDRSEPDSLPVDIALGTARMIVNNLEDEERIVPKAVLNLFKDERYLPLNTTLQNLQKNYEHNDSKGMASAIISAVDILTRQIPELSEKKTIRARLQKLYSDGSIQNKYSINKEIIWALDTARIIRNYEVEHPDAVSTGVVTMREAIATAHLMVLFLSTLLASGGKFVWDQG